MREISDRIIHCKIIFGNDFDSGHIDKVLEMLDKSKEPINEIEIEINLQ